MPFERARWGLALAPLCLAAASCSSDVTARPQAERAEEAQPQSVEIRLLPKRDTARYEFSVEQRSLDEEGSFEVAEGEVRIRFHEFTTGRVRATFAVTGVEGRRGANRNALSPSSAIRSRLEGLLWSSKHDPTGTVIGPVETKRADAWHLLRTLGAERGFFGVSYPAGRAKEGQSWRAATPGLEWQLASVSEWLATLEGVLEIRLEDATLSQSIRARVEVATGLPLEIVGDETLTQKDETTVMRHWSLSLIE